MEILYRVVTDGLGRVFVEVGDGGEASIEPMIVWDESPTGTDPDIDENYFSFARAVGIAIARDLADRN
jgi:hypothetical protein